MFNRRHKAILFITLVMTGTALLTGATLGEGLGTLILGAAFAWLVGSETASRAYRYIRRLPNKAWAWTRVQLLMAIGGCVLAATAAWSNFNSFLVCAAMAFFGILMSPFAQVPTQRRWLKWLLWVLALVVFFFSTLGASMLSATASQNPERVGELCVYGLIALSIGMIWLVRGWRLILAGVSDERPVIDSQLEPIRDQRGTKWLYVSLFTGTVILTFWLGLLAFSGFSDSVFPFQAKATAASSNPLSPAIFLVLLGWWPYACWRRVLEREPNSSGANVKRHKRVTIVLAVLFTVVLCASVTFGVQNGADRMSTAEVEKGTKDFQDVAQQIGKIKGRDLRTTREYIDAYEEIEPLLADFDGKLQRFTEILDQAQGRDKARGPFNVQRFYGGKEKEWLSWDFRIFDLLRQDSEITKKQIAVIKQMERVPEQYQVAVWTKNFQTLQEDEATLRQKIASTMAEMPDKRK